MYRQFGRLSLYHDLAGGNYSKKVRTSIQRALLSIQQQTPNQPVVIICTSLIGGTGGAIALDVAYLVRHILATIRMNPYDGHIVGVFALGNIFASALSQAPEEQHIKFILNEVAAIKEIQHLPEHDMNLGHKAKWSPLTTLSHSTPIGYLADTEAEDWRVSGRLIISL